MDLEAELLALFFRTDPIGLNFETNTDEYEPEVETVLARLPSAASAADVQRILHDEFTHWFDADIAGPIKRYEKLAEAVWALWLQAREAGQPGT